MSSKRRKPKPHTLVLKKGHFYNVHDGSKKGHPGRIEIADYSNDFYVSITTGSLTKEEFQKKKYRKDYIRLSHPTTKDVYISLLHKRPFIGARDDYGDSEYPNMKIHSFDEPIVKNVLKKQSRKGYWHKRKNKKPSY